MGYLKNLTLKAELEAKVSELLVLCLYLCAKLGGQCCDAAHLCSQ